MFYIAHLVVETPGELGFLLCPGPGILIPISKSHSQQASVKVLYRSEPASNMKPHVPCIARHKA